ncbi:hypothetical protein GX51_06854 [Blastomyces parvus]|uniref:Uncharacterized protein n=1 Tax=Blastomyces parvus TaxID=2060905 RepID=A0A2B7WPF5_9EURO|nr:hypothetical protein GX51_06854 [Blastomyces parvus]
MAEQQSTTPPAILAPPSGQVSPTPGTNEADTRSSTDHSLPTEATSTQDVADDVLAEYNAALAADPSLRSATPQAEWEDYETILAQNPELLAAVVTDKTKTFYTSKNKWECGHEGPEIPTDIEKEPGDDDGGNSATLITECQGLCPHCLDPETNPALQKETIVDGKVFYMSKDKWECGHAGDEILTDIEKDPLDIQAGKPSVLINEMKGICPTCMEKWHKLETGDGDDGGELGGPSSGPAGGGSSSPPTYDEALEADGPYDQVDEEEGEDRLAFQVGLLDLDDGPSKGKNAERDHSPAGSPGIEGSAAGGSGSRMKATANVGRAPMVCDDDDYPDDEDYDDDPVDEKGYGDKYATYYSSGDEEDISGRNTQVEIEINTNRNVNLEVEINPAADSVENARPKQKKPTE